MAHKVTIIVPVKDEIVMFKYARENGFLGAQRRLGIAARPLGEKGQKTISEYA